MKENVEPQLTYTSEDGGILMIEIKQNQKCLVVNVYAPNISQENFYEQFNTELMKKEYDEHCLVGDFNAVFDRSMNRKSRKTGKKTGCLLPKTFLKIGDELNLVDQGCQT